MSVTLGWALHVFSAVLTTETLLLHERISCKQPAQVAPEVDPENWKLLIVASGTLGLGSFGICRVLGSQRSLTAVLSIGIYL